MCVCMCVCVYLDPPSSPLNPTYTPIQLSRWMCLVTHCVESDDTSSACACVASVALNEAHISSHWVSYRWVPFFSDDRAMRRNCMALSAKEPLIIWLFCGPVATHWVSSRGVSLMARWSVPNCTGLFCGKWPIFHRMAMRYIQWGDTQWVTSETQ